MSPSAGREEQAVGITGSEHRKRLQENSMEGPQVEAFECAARES